MDNGKHRKNFEFMKYFFHEPKNLESFLLFQVGETMLENGSSIRSHVQICHEITYVFSGKGYVLLNGKKQKIGHGDIHVVSKGDIHEIHSDSTDGLRFAYIGFDFENSDDPRLCKLNCFYANSPKNCVSDKGEVSSLFRMFITEWYEEPENNMLIIPSLLNCLLTYVKRLYDNENNIIIPPKKSDPVVSHNVFNILHYIDSNIITITNLKSIANQFGYTENYISHLFKAKTGMCIKKYIMSSKMKIASDILLNTGCRITEVAERLGYSSSQSFSRMFRVNMGCSPSEFRTKALKSYNNKINFEEKK